jgi:ribonuclease PH
MLNTNRSITFELQNNGFASAAVIAKNGNTHVFCTVCIEEGVPQWLKGKNKGWLTAEYALLPGSTPTRTKRDRSAPSGRSMEIQRLIGRALRHAVDLNFIKDKTLFIDCDVLQADGGTRTTSINAASVAVAIALQKHKKISSEAWKGLISATSIGMKEEKKIIDPDYAQDSTADIDSNFVFTEKKECIEIQSSGEKTAYSKATFDLMFQAASDHCDAIFALQHAFLKATGLF